MKFKDQIEAFGPGRWDIPLGTHLGTPIPNETSELPGPLSIGRRKEEARYASIFRRVREPVTGYNCFGHVFASRRTAIYPEVDFPLERIIEMILAEDGFGEISYDELRVGDVVIYSDERGMDHAARVVGVPHGTSPPGTGGGAERALSVFVRSKFNSDSGEYEHPLEDTGWSRSRMERKYYRDRHQSPVPKGWRGLIARVEADAAD